MRNVSWFMNINRLIVQVACNVERVFLVSFFDIRFRAKFVPERLSSRKKLGYANEIRELFFLEFFLWESDLIELPNVESLIKRFLRINK